MGVIYAVLLSASIAVAKDHQDNPLYQQFIKEGVDVGGKSRAMFPPPAMSDGLDAAGQKKVLLSLVEGSYDLDDFVRYSIEAPRILRRRDIESSDPQAPARGIDFYFVAYGNWAKVTDKHFIERAWNSSSKEGSSKTLTAADLARRKIEIPANQAIGHSTFPLFGRVEISATGHSCWSRTPDAFLAAGKVDRRFDKDPEFPNQWRSMKKDDDGNTVFGPPQPYHGAYYYMKMTRLHDPKDAILIEGHVIFNEPKGWFEGENALGSKLPLALQVQTRALRREFLKAQ